MQRLSSGSRAVDDVLDGLITGDNVVWTGGDDAFHHPVQRAFLADGLGPAVYVTTGASPAAVAARVDHRVEILDARPGQPYADAMLLEAAILERATADTRVVIDSLDAFVRRLQPARAFAFYSRVCPQLFDIGALCYWRTGKGSRAILDGVRSVTQCLVDVGASQLHVVKADGRHDAQGRVFRFRIVDGEIHVEHERALARLAEGLRRVRATRDLTQADLARAAGISPSAISQAEAARRGLALDTVMAISRGLGVGIDELLGTAAHPGYVIARRDRAPVRQGSTPLLDDPDAGLRAYLVQLRPGESGEPPTAHKGPELVVIASGLVQIDLGAERPAMRAGDAVLATHVAIRAWHNLIAKPAHLFWIPRDPVPRST
jgi:transcriptional regulator with XRE-family HTH domain